MSNPSQIVQKLWNYCNVLRDDGMSYLLARGAQASSDYPSAPLRAGHSAELRAGVEQLAYLLFLKMADERTKPLLTMRLL
jgi:type I restriction enzyme M protein